MASQDADNKNTDQVVLSYYDSLLRLSDVNLLKGPYWLNDTIIGFYYEYLTQQCKKEDNDWLQFISPSVTHLMMCSDHTWYNDFLDTMHVKFHNRVIFFPVNNGTSTSSGTHWSLLIYSYEEEMCYYCDSFIASSDLTKVSNFARDLTRYVHGTQDRKFVEITCPQQNNGYDCGIHVLCMTDVISRHLLENSKVRGCDFSAIPEMVQHKRAQLLNLIETLKTTHSTDDE